MDDRHRWSIQNRWGGLLYCVCVLVIAGCNDVSSTSPTSPAPTGPSALAIATTSLPDGMVNLPYVASVAATGGITPYSWSVTPTLPANLNLDPSTGIISGTPTVQGTTTLTFTVHDSSSPVQTVQHALQLAIEPPPVPPTIITSSLPIGTVNAPYPATTLTAAGGIPPLTWQPVGLPFGLMFDASTHTISGTPTSNGTANVTFTIHDAAVPTNQVGTRTLALTVNAALTINTASLPNGTVNQTYGPVTLMASGGTPPYTWSITGSPSTPAPGLSLSSGGMISGVPTTGGAFVRTYRLQDQNGIAVTTSLTLNVGTVTIDNTSPLPNGKEVFPYTPLTPLATMTASGGTPPYGNWSVSPPLPTGLILDPSSGQIIGIPAPGTAGTTTHTFSVTDSANVTATKPNLSLTILPAL